MRWAGFMVTIVVGGLVSLWVLRDSWITEVIGFLVFLFVLGAVWVVWAAVSGALSQRWVAWHEEWAAVGSHPVAVSFALLAVAVTGWMASGMVPEFPVGAAVLLAGVIGYLVSLVERRVPAFLVAAVALLGIGSVAGLGFSAREPVSVETAIIVGLVLFTTAVVALVIMEPGFRWTMVAVGSLAAGYVWSGLAVLQFAPITVPFKRVAIAGLLGASIVALILSLVARGLGRDSGEVPGSQE